MRYLTAGESHGKQLTTIIEGLPAQLPITADELNDSLIRRQGGYGRGRRMKIEKDLVSIMSGVRHGYTIGSPVTLALTNDDFKNWQDIMGEDPVDPNIHIRRQVTKPRPGHADLNGGMKYNHDDLRNVLERSSARETAARVAAGSMAKKLLSELGITVAGYVRQIYDVQAADLDLTIEEKIERVRQSEVNTIDLNQEEAMKRVIDQAKQDGDSIGGVVEVTVDGLPPGLGSYVQYDRKLDGKIAAAVMSINAFKGVEFGIGFSAAHTRGSETHDEIAYDEDQGYHRKTNRLGGFEGGMTTGMPIVVKGVMKPIPTLYKPLESVDIHSKEPFKASIERSDSCAVPAASVVMEHVVAWEVAAAIVEQFPSDYMEQLKAALTDYRERVRTFG
ncbi:chorismate synthase [Alkalibacillus almallahensis]|uniref:chorismate synthase n=1 Tax=Alkalibacillus almallahensis TaxID=1379154 RepID=UPI001422433F|nr:chorismate synthase [Alkalibacillus almallahensis]NIK12303.1 chorismate synthase [Alkalibacillus almallahensis]